MSFIYEYQLRNAKERQRENLLVYQQELENLLKESFGSNLKETITFEKSFEFRLYASIDSKDLRKLFKKIKKKIYSEHGFVRKEQTVYAIVNDIDENSKIVSLEFVDALVVNSELYSQRVNRFFENNMMLDYSEEIKNNCYIDVYSAEICAKRFLCIVKKDKVSVGDCYLFKVWHQRKYQNDRTIKYNEVELDRIFDYNYLELKEKDKNNNISDYLVIQQSRADNFNFKIIESRLKLTLKPLENECAQLKMYKKKKIVFCVHNVGQALATSFSYEEEIPFLYFDYGLPNSRNSHTLPKDVNLPVDEKTKIILSHVHKDHWLGINMFINAYKCSWYIPNQRRGIQFNHKVAEILRYGGSVQLINSDINGRNFSVSCAGISIHNPKRLPSVAHETGLTLCVDAYDELGNNCKILIAGDQDYDYVRYRFLCDVNILVASHHGGKYSWTKHCMLPIPTKKYNCIIYSYGKCNTYQHPNEYEYKAYGWTTEHHTSKNGSYKKVIMANNIDC